ncbi:MAG TPA: cytochrome d ubiquinol oxidase subunit II [Marinagarivorans sp.]
MNAELLATIFIALMGLAVLVYAIADGYDLGTGLLLPLDNEAQRDTMIASIGPFWDANETWLVLAVGLLLIAFPTAHSLVFYHLYIPATFMLAGLILRGVSFDFRAKTSVTQKPLWDKAFKFGSLLTSFCQGYMLGRYVLGFADGWQATSFAVLSGFGVTAAYGLIGAAWLIYKTEGELQQRAKNWLGLLSRVTLAGIFAVSLANLAVNPEVFSRWFEMPLALLVIPIPALCLAGFAYLEWSVAQNKRAYRELTPLLVVMLIFITSFCGLAFSFFPDIVPGQLTIWQAASAPESLRFLLVGTAIVVPTIGIYTGYSYWVFRGKATHLSYE